MICSMGKILGGLRCPHEDSGDRWNSAQCMADTIGICAGCSLQFGVYFNAEQTWRVSERTNQIIGKQKWTVIIFLGQERYGGDKI